MENIDFYNKSPLHDSSNTSNTSKKRKAKDPTDYSKDLIKIIADAGAEKSIQKKNRASKKSKNLPSDSNSFHPKLSTEVENSQSKLSNNRDENSLLRASRGNVHSTFNSTVQEIRQVIENVQDCSVKKLLQDILYFEKLPFTFKPLTLSQIEEVKEHVLKIKDIALQDPIQSNKSLELVYRLTSLIYCLRNKNTEYTIQWIYSFVTQELFKSSPYYAEKTSTIASMFQVVAEQLTTIEINASRLSSEKSKDLVEFCFNQWLNTALYSEKAASILSMSTKCPSMLQELLGIIEFLVEMHPKEIENLDFISEKKIKKQLHSAFQSVLNTTFQQAASSIKQDTSLEIVAAHSIVFLPVTLARCVLTNTGQINTAIISKVSVLFCTFCMEQNLLTPVQIKEIKTTLKQVAFLKDLRDSIISAKEPHKDNEGARLAIRSLLQLSPKEKLTVYHTRLALLSTLLSDWRQGRMGTCSVASLIIQSRQTNKIKIINDLKEIFECSGLKAILKGQEVFAQTVFKNNLDLISKKASLDDLIGPEQSLSQNLVIQTACREIGIAQDDPLIQQVLTQLRDESDTASYSDLILKIIEKKFFEKQSEEKSKLFQRAAFAAVSMLEQPLYRVLENTIINFEFVPGSSTRQNIFQNIQLRFSLAIIKYCGQDAQLMKDAFTFLLPFLDKQLQKGFIYFFDPTVSAADNDKAFVLHYENIKGNFSPVHSEQEFKNAFALQILRTLETLQQSKNIDEKYATILKKLLNDTFLWDSCVEHMFLMLDQAYLARKCDRSMLWHYSVTGGKAVQTIYYNEQLQAIKAHRDQSPVRSLDAQLETMVLANVNDQKMHSYCRSLMYVPGHAVEFFPYHHSWPKSISSSDEAKQWVEDFQIRWLDALNNLSAKAIHAQIASYVTKQFQVSDFDLKFKEYLEDEETSLETDTIIDSISALTYLKELMNFLDDEHPIEITDKSKQDLDIFLLTKGFPIDTQEKLRSCTLHYASVLYQKNLSSSDQELIHIGIVPSIVSEGYVQVRITPDNSRWVPIENSSLFEKQRSLEDEVIDSIQNMVLVAASIKIPGKQVRYPMKVDNHLLSFLPNHPTMPKNIDTWQKAEIWFKDYVSEWNNVYSQTTIRQNMIDHFIKRVKNTLQNVDMGEFKDQIHQFLNRYPKVSIRDFLTIAFDILQRCTSSPLIDKDIEDLEKEFLQVLSTANPVDSKLKSMIMHYADSNYPEIETDVMKHIHWGIAILPVSLKAITVSITDDNSTLLIINEPTDILVRNIWQLPRITLQNHLIQKALVFTEKRELIESHKLALLEEQLREKIRQLEKSKDLINHHKDLYEEAQRALCQFHSSHNVSTSIISAHAAMQKASQREEILKQKRQSIDKHFEELQECIIRFSSPDDRSRLSLIELREQAIQSLQIPKSFTSQEEFDEWANKVDTVLALQNDRIQEEVLVHLITQLKDVKDFEMASL